MRGSRNFCQRGSNSDNVCLLFCYFDEGREDTNNTKRGPSSNAGSVALCLIQGIRTSIVNKPYIFDKKKTTKQTLSKLDPL